MMTGYKTLTALLLSLALVAPATAQNTATAPDDDAAVMAVSKIPTNVHQFSVNGVQVILRSAGPANRVVAVKLFVRGGLAALPRDMSPAVEQLALDVPILSGPQGMTKGEFRRLTDRMVTRLDASAGRDFSVMNMRCVDEQFDKSWDIFSGIVLRPQFDDTELRNTKQRTLVGIRNRLISPAAYCNFLADSIFFAGHPYGRYAKEADVEAINTQALQSFRRDILVKSRLLLVVVGNVDSADLYRKVSATLGTLPQGSYVEQALPIPANASKASVTVRPAVGAKDVATNYIVARFWIPGRTHAMYYPMYRLASFLSGSLFREVRIERNLSYAPDADATYNKTSYGEITISTTLPDSAWRVTKNEVLNFFRNYIVGEESMKSGIASWTTSTYIKQQTSASQAAELGLAEIYSGNWKNAFGLVEGMKNVSPTDMNEAAQRYLTDMTVVIVGNPKVVHAKEYMPEAPTGKTKKTPKGKSGSGIKSDGSDSSIDMGK